MSVAFTWRIDLIVSMLVELVLSEEDGNFLFLLPDDDDDVMAITSLQDCTISGSNSNCTSRYRFFWRTMLYVNGNDSTETIDALEIDLEVQ